MDDTALLTCPYCFENVEVYIDPQSEGELIRTATSVAGPGRCRSVGAWTGSFSFGRIARNRRRELRAPLIGRMVDGVA